MIRPIDIQENEFSKAVRGYKEDEVNEFLPSEFRGDCSGNAGGGQGTYGRYFDERREAGGDPAEKCRAGCTADAERSAGYGG